MIGCGGGKFELENEEEQIENATAEFVRLKNEGRL
jgi:hypothetical protein